MKVQFELYWQYEILLPQDRSEVESSLGVRLPDDYWSFLLKNNGGTFPVGVTASHSKCKSGLGLLHFYHYEMPRHKVSGSNGSESDSLADQSELTEEVGVIGDDWRPIGACEGDVLILLGVKGKVIGHVVEYIDSVVYGVEKRSVLAKTFGDFLSGLAIFQRIVQLDPEFQAAEMGDSERLRGYLKGGFDVDAVAPNGQSLLRLALNRPATTSVVLEFGPDLLKLDMARRTPLHDALGSCPVESARILISELSRKGILEKNLSMVDLAGMSPTDYAIGAGPLVVQALTDVGVKVSAN